MASGHVGGFNDPLMDCKACKARFRADKLIEDFTKRRGDRATAGPTRSWKTTSPSTTSSAPCCGKKDFTGIRQFNLMFKTFAGRDRGRQPTRFTCGPRPRRASSSTSKTCMRTTRKKLPVGIAQIGKSFRNEITPGNFIFRVREFEQMELEFFCKPGDGSGVVRLLARLLPRLAAEPWACKEENLRLRDHEPEKLSFYSKATTDFEYPVPLRLGRAVGRGRPY